MRLKIELTMRVLSQLDEVRRIRDLFLTQLESSWRNNS
jgi:hypothetical protein